MIETHLMNQEAQSKGGPDPIFGKCIHIGIGGTTKSQLEVLSCLGGEGIELVIREREKGS